MEQENKPNTEATPEAPKGESSGVNSSRRAFATAGLAALGAAALAGTAEAAPQSRKSKILSRIKSDMSKDEVASANAYGKVGGLYEKGVGSEQQKSAKRNENA